MQLYMTQILQYKVTIQRSTVPHVEDEKRNAQPFKGLNHLHG